MPSKGYRYVGTRKLGRYDDPIAILDTELQVRGVADARVLLLLMTCHLQMACLLGIGEKAADLT